MSEESKSSVGPGEWTTVPSKQIQNMEIWGQIDSTDPTFTKKLTTGAKLTSINGQYQFKKMTETFGPCGQGWGFETTSSQFIETGPILSNISNDNGQPIQLDMGSVHTLRVKLWYYAKPKPKSGAVEGQLCYIEGVGHTPFKYASKRDGQVVVLADLEYEKKSLTDALTNAMAKLGMSADVRMGMFDIPDYINSQYDDMAIVKASDAEVEATIQRQEFEVWFQSHMDLIKSSCSAYELEKIFKGGRPRVMRQGSSQQQADHNNAKNDTFRELMPKSDKELKQ